MRLMLLILLLSAPCALSHDLSRFIMAIDIPLDNKGEAQAGRISIKYNLYPFGGLSAMRWVQNHSAQALGGKQLTAEEFTTATNILAQLPPIRVELPADQTLRIIIYPPLNPITNVYSRTELPADMERLFNIFGGIRGEIKGKLKFSLEQGAAPHVAQGAPSGER